MADFVDRFALRDALYKADAITMKGVEIINQFPAADVAPVRHGRWHRPYISWLFPLKIKNPYCFCTNCIHPVKPKRKTRYCPNCGAKMDGDTFQTG